MTHREYFLSFKVISGYLMPQDFCRDFEPWSVPWICKFSKIWVKNIMVNASIRKISGITVRKFKFWNINDGHRLWLIAIQSPLNRLKRPNDLAYLYSPLYWAAIWIKMYLTDTTSWFAVAFKHAFIAILIKTTIFKLLFASTTMIFYNKFKFPKCLIFIHRILQK